MPKLCFNYHEFFYTLVKADTKNKHRLGDYDVST